MPLIEARDQTRNLMVPSRIHFHCATTGTPFQCFFFVLFCFLAFVVVVAISWAAPAAYGGSQARGRMGAVATGLRQRHSKAGSEPRLQPTPQLTATPDR